MKKRIVIKSIFFLSIFFLILTLDYSIKNVLKLVNNYLMKDVRIKNEIFHHTLKPNSSGGGIINEKYYTNSLGFRDFYIKKINPVKDNNLKKRIILIGDSATMGLYNEYEDSFAGKITNHYKDMNIEVLNAAVTSYSPVIYYTKIKYLINVEKLKFDELLVFLDISDTFDDLYRYELDISGKVLDKKKNNQTNIDKIEKIKQFVTNNFFLLFYLSNFIHDIFFPDELNLQDWVLNHQNNMWNISKDKNFILEAENGLKLNTFYMNNLKKILDDNNIKMKLIIYPWPGTLYYYDNEETIYESHWKNWSLENEVKFFNFVEYFDYIKKSNKDERMNLIKEIYHHNDMHLNKKGSDIFFKQIQIFLD